MSPPDPIQLKKTAAKVDSFSRLFFRSQQKGKSPWDPKKDSAEQYDYIIVGGGAAGAVVANRLAEDPEVKVLILEAGGTDDFLSSRVPGLAVMIQESKSDWSFRTTPQSGLNGRRLHQPRGKMLGGSSSMNAMMYQRGPASDFDKWAEILGDNGWSYKECLPYFKKSEGFHDPDLPAATTQAQKTSNTKFDTFEPEFHGTTGPWRISYQPMMDCSASFIEATQKEGIPITKDLNGKTSLGTTRIQTYIQPSDAIRSSLARAFLDKTAVPGGASVKRGTIRAVLRAMVTRILVQEQKGQKVAQGVEFVDEKTNVCFRIDARREVILCAGSFGSPQLLLASGIGPSPLAHVPHIHTLPGVGQNLRDHIGVNVVFSAHCETYQRGLRFIPSLTSLFKHLTKGIGYLTSNGAEAAAFGRLEDIAPEFVAREKAQGTYKEMTSGPLCPHFELIAAPAYFRQHGHIMSPDWKDYYTIMAVLLTPCSEGTFTINTTKNGSTVAVEPLIDPGYMTDKEQFDIRVMAEIIRFVRRIGRRMAQDPKIGGQEFFPGEDKVPNDDQEALHRFIRETGETLYHPTSTCRMGPTTDRLAVVDSRLNVYGIDRLRVADASVMPKLPAAHTCAPTVMIAERAADIIKAGRKDSVAVL
ncbi:hypothetical protein BGZ83_001301 [Gryganskiella cystojenkinii]|nr:hypothetical protein BGZ83_001301 [Gryganskiella cystojenkinii]